MNSENQKWNRRTLLKMTAGLAAGCNSGQLAAAVAPVKLGEAHRRAVDRRRRIVVQYDANNALGKDWDRWLDYRFSWIDEPGVQIDAIWWDIQPLLKNYYPTPPGSLIYQWPDPTTDLVARLVDETRERGLEVFWNHRISEVDIRPPGSKGWPDQPHPFKEEHPDWLLKTWWPHGLWNLAVEEVREYKLGLLRHVIETYPLDGIQLDFARHVPCLPPGQQWELRHHVTDFVRMVREMTQEVARKRGRPILLAARLPRNLEGCRVDGFDVETWAEQNLLDIFSLGSRSMEIDLAAYRRITGGSHIKLQPCSDDHHAPAGYRCPPIEVFRGLFANWWQQGADSVMTFNWACADPELCEEMGGEVAPLSELEAYREVGDYSTMSGKDKTFVVERRGGYPWAEGYFNRNDDSPLPLSLVPDSSAANLEIGIADPVAAEADKVREIILSAVFFGAADDESIEICLNGTRLEIGKIDPRWKDPQIFSPREEPSSGGKFARYRINPKQKLLRVEYLLDPGVCRIGVNQVEIRRISKAGSSTSIVNLEKLEVELRYL